MGHFEDAIGYLEQQLATLEQLSSSNILIDKVRPAFYAIDNYVEKCYILLTLFFFFFFSSGKSVW